MDPVKPLRADARRKRDALLAKAREMFDAGSFFDLRFDDFAGLAGVGVGTLYRHFPTREELAEAVFREEVTALCDRVRQLKEDLPAVDALASFLRGFVDYLDDHRGLAQTLATLMGSRASALAEGSQALERAVLDLLDTAVSEGSVRADVDGGAVMMALHGIGAAHDRPNWRSEADGLVTVVLAGLRSAGEETAGPATPRR
ncbi:TetR/AcrR family transcriptional regulator [Lentzea sp. NPDC059081]|uniref:TetR/AcrR family transcriptional regulator n=1 Tax=Lentzea sp. NPDC059081 TaxID=3346719 RepID=UPI0036BF501B